MALGNERNAENCQPGTAAGGTHAKAAASWTFKDVLTSSDQFVLTLNPVSKSSFHLSKA